MPPVNRNEPKRAASSESQYSLMEFMREFPDDAACLAWLWRPSQTAATLTIRVMRSARAERR
jgi:hypothetical protein